MPNQLNLDKTYLKIASTWANNMSNARRLKVGCIIVNDGQIISDGFNGTPSGFDNNCEYDTYKDGIPILVTKPEVLHAESNALMKLCKSTNSSLGSTIYLTHSPCFDCSKLILQSGIIRVVYNMEYRTNDGINFLKQSDITVDQINI
jgi:dCMP deaminase